MLGTCDAAALACSYHTAFKKYRFEILHILMVESTGIFDTVMHPVTCVCVCVLMELMLV